MKPVIGALVIAFGVIVPAEGQSVEYYPLEQGRTWTYRVTKTDTKGEEKAHEFTRRTIPARMLDDKQVTPLEYSKNGQTTGWVYVIENSTGILWYARQGVKQSAPTLFGNYTMRYPIEVGASWGDSMSSYLLPVKEKVPYTATIIILTDSITVPAGHFDNCLRLRMQGKKKIEGGLYWGGTVIIDATDWHCAGIGFVKSMLEQRIDHPLVDFRATKTEKLVRYHK